MRSVVIGDSCEKQRKTKTTDDTMNEKDTYVWDDAIWIIIENHVTFFCFSFLRGSLTRPDIECTLNAVCIAQRHMVCVSRASETITRPHLIDLRKMCNRRLPVQHSDLICLNHYQVESLKNVLPFFVCFCFKHSYPRMGRTVSHMKRFQWIKRAQNNERPQNKESSGTHERLDDDRAHTNMLTGIRKEIYVQ